MTRTLCDELSEPVVQAYNDMEDEILALIGRQLGKNKQVSDTSKWRLRQLAMSGELERRTVEIIASYAGGIDEAVVDALYAAALAEVAYTDAAIQEAVRQGILEGNIEQPASRSATFAVQQFRKQAEVDTNLVNTVMQYSAKSKYVNAVNEIADSVIRSRQDVLNVMGEGAAAAVSGQMSLQEATRHTIHKLARQGCPGFIDKAGREWTPEAYVSMDMRSTLANTAREAQDTRCTEFGVQLIAVSSHNGARPLCAPYQGRIFSRDGTSGKTTDGAGRQIDYIPLTQTSYGQPAGLFGINCGHQQYPFIPGVNVQRYFPYDEEENAEKYRQSQKQRAMERQIRAQKRECMMLQEAGDEEGLKDASKKLREYKDKYRDYSKQHGLYTHNDRTQVYGYDRSKSMKTVWAEKRSGLTGSAERSIIDREINGQRRSRYYLLTEDDITHIKCEAQAIGIPTEMLRFNKGNQTGFSDRLQKINIRGDIFPDLSSEHNRDLLSERAVLAHEYYGHYKSYPSKFPVGDWRDEFEASYNAAINTPNLSTEDRARLMIDAYDRAKEAGHPRNYDDVARRLIHGY